MVGVTYHHLQPAAAAAAKYYVLPKVLKHFIWFLLSLHCERSTAAGVLMTVCRYNGEVAPAFSGEQLWVITGVNEL